MGEMPCYIDDVTLLTFTLTMSGSPFLQFFFVFFWPKKLSEVVKLIALKLRCIQPALFVIVNARTARKSRKTMKLPERERENVVQTRQRPWRWYQPVPTSQWQQVFQLVKKYSQADQERKRLSTSALQAGTYQLNLRFKVIISYCCKCEFLAWVPLGRQFYPWKYGYC